MKGARMRTLKPKYGVLFLGILCFFLFSVFIHSKKDVLKNMGINFTESKNSSPSVCMDHTVAEGSQTVCNMQHKLVPPYPYDYKFIINQPDKCKDKTPFLVVLVISEGKAVATRNAIRRTWGNESNISDVPIIRLFVTAISPGSNTTVQDLLQRESDVYSDIIQQDFLDSYSNLTLKTLMGMEWVNKYCPDASYVLKIDSDMFLNVDYLVHHLLKPADRARKNYISGYYIPTFRVNRNKGNKYSVPKELFSRDMYPSYVAGPGYVFSSDMAKKIYDVAQVIPLIHVEDAFVGICLEKLNIKITVPPRNLFNGHKIEYDVCTFHTLIMAHHYSPGELLQIWEDFKNHNSKCPPIKK